MFCIRHRGKVECLDISNVVTSKVTLVDSVEHGGKSYSTELNKRCNILILKIYLLVDSVEHGGKSYSTELNKRCNILILKIYFKFSLFTKIKETIIINIQ